MVGTIPTSSKKKLSYAFDIVRTLCLEIILRSSFVIGEEVVVTHQCHDRNGRGTAIRFTTKLISASYGSLRLFYFTRYSVACADFRKK